MKIELKLTIELPEEWKGSGDQVIRELMTHYDDLGHLAGEYTVVRGTIETEDGYYSTQKSFAKEKI